MTNFNLLPFLFIAVFMGSASPSLAQGVSAESNAVSDSGPGMGRHLIRRKLCEKFGLCGQGSGYNQGGYQGGYNQGYPGYQAQIPPINIGISQSQSSSSLGGGGYGHGSYPNNYQFNNPNGYYGAYPGGFNRPGYFGNGFGSSNNQFNGNYYGGAGGYGGYPSGGYPFGGYPSGGYSNGFRPYRAGPYYDESATNQGNSNQEDDSSSEYAD